MAKIFLILILTFGTLFPISQASAQMLRFSTKGLYTLPIGGLTGGSYSTRGEFGFADPGLGLSFGLAIIDEDYPDNEILPGLELKFNIVSLPINSSRIQSDFLAQAPDTSDIVLKYKTPWNLYYGTINLPLIWSFDWIEAEAGIGFSLGAANAPTYSFTESGITKYEMTQNSAFLIGLNANLGVGVPLFGNRLVVRAGVEFMPGMISLTQDFEDRIDGRSVGGDASYLFFLNTNAYLGLSVLIGEL